MSSTFTPSKKITLTKAKKRRLLENGRSDIVELFLRKQSKSKKPSSLSTAATRTTSLNQQPQASLCSHPHQYRSPTTNNYGAVTVGLFTPPHDSAINSGENSAIGHITAGNYELEQQKKFYEEKLAMQLNEFVKERSELVRECNELKRKVDELTLAESVAKKRCNQLEYHYHNKKKKVRENLARIWEEEDEDDLMSGPKSFMLRGINYTLTDDEYLEFQSGRQFGAAVDRFIAIAKITTPITKSDMKELEVAVDSISGVARCSSAGQRTKRWSNFKNRYPHHFNGISDDDNENDIIGKSDNNTSASSLQ